MNAAKIHKLGHWAYNHNIPLLPKIVEAFIQLIYACRISASCKIGKGTSFAYLGMGVLVVSNTVFGENCSIGAGVKIVRKFPYKNVPEFGDNVYIGPNAVICGPVKIGNNSIIAPNAVVLNSVPIGGIVGGIPAKLLGNTSELDYNIFDNPKYKEGFASYIDA